MFELQSVEKLSSQAIFNFHVRTRYSTPSTKIIKFPTSQQRRHLSKKTQRQVGAIFSTHFMVPRHCQHKPLRSCSCYSSPRVVKRQILCERKNSSSCQRKRGKTTGAKEAKSLIWRLSSTHPTISYAVLRFTIGALVTEPPSREGSKV